VKARPTALGLPLGGQMRVFSARSGVLQRDLNQGVETRSHRMTNKGGKVVSPRPTTTRGDIGANAAGADAPNERGRDVVFTFYDETWTDAQRRAMYMAGDRLLETLLTTPAVRRLVVGNPYRSAPILWARRLAGQRRAPFPEGPDRMLVEPRRLRRGNPTSVRALERACAKYDNVLERATVEVGASEPVVITTNPFIAGFAPLRWASGVTFYCWDDWMSGLPVRPWWPAYAEAYARVRESARGLVAVSQAIVDRVLPTGPSAVVPNGVVPDEWRSPQTAPPWFAALPSPRILYVGVIDDRLDPVAVREIAARFSHGSVVFLGPVGDQRVVDPLRRLPNVHVEPPVGRAGVARVVHAADVCVMPHVRTRITAAMSPLKLYEYLAGGRPVAATDLPPVRAVDSRIVTVREGESFADGVAAALDTGPLTEDERLAFIDANSWQRRHDELLGVAFGVASSRGASSPHAVHATVGEPQPVGFPMGPDR
jgi:teichuronic acid biosynthesis glycosyltransferase TuaH